MKMIVKLEDMDGERDFSFKTYRAGNDFFKGLHASYMRANDRNEIDVALHQILDGHWIQSNFFTKPKTFFIDNVILRTIKDFECVQCERLIPKGSCRAVHIDCVNGMFGETSSYHLECFPYPTIAEKYKQPTIELRKLMFPTKDKWAQLYYSKQSLSKQKFVDGALKA